MTQTYKKKLIEVAIPLEAINAAAVREKSIRHGHPSTLHLWWARRPLAACRAVLFAQLVDDPSSLPDEFPTQEAQEAERKRLFAIIEDLVKWENSTNEEVLERARAEIRRSCARHPDGTLPNGDLKNVELPPVYDPFSGGGSIPLEAQRLGLPAYGSDLNPVAVMIGKAMIEIPPKFKDREPIHPGLKERNHYRNAEGLAEDVKHYGAWMGEKAFERIGHLYPQVDLPSEYGGGKATVIAWIWARTVPSPDPAFADVQVPIASSFLLSSKKGKEAWIEPIVDRVAKMISYHVRHGGTDAEIAKAREGTKAGRGAHFRCLMSDTAITPDYVKRMGRDGKMGQTLIAIVAEGKGGRRYVEPLAKHEQIARTAEPKWKPEAPLPNDKRAFWTPPYGLRSFGDLFTDRQLVALNTFSDLVHEARAQIEADGMAAGLSTDPTPLRGGGKGAKAYAEAVSVYLGLCVGRMANRASSLNFWDKKGENVQQVFARQGLPMTWDFVEGNVFSSSTGNFVGQVGYLVRAVEALPASALGIESQEDARHVDYLPDAVLNTDPPYYDNIGYADLSDFFYIWLRPVLKEIYPEAMSVLSTPKANELVATPYRHKGKKQAEIYFLEGMREVMENAVRSISPKFPAAIYYAFKAQEFKSDGLSSLPVGRPSFRQS